MAISKSEPLSTAVEMGKSKWLQTMVEKLGAKLGTEGRDMEERGAYRRGGNDESESGHCDSREFEEGGG